MALRRFGVGVYALDGRMIQAGDERSESDGFLYDFEVALLARDAPGQPTRSLQDAFDKIRSMVRVTSSNDEFSAATFVSAMTQAIVDARAHPNDENSAAPIILDDLVAATAGVDLKEKTDLARPTLNRLTFWLLVAAVGFGVLSQVPVGQPHRSIRHPLSEPEPLPRGLSLCSEIGEAGGRDLWTGFAKFGLTLIKPIGNFVKVSMVIVDGLHGSLLAFSVAVESESELVGPGHYGHKQLGTPLRFRARVVMRDDLPKELTECGWLTGVIFPKKGPMAGVGFNVFGLSALERHGSVHCEEKCYTDSNGWVSATFVPRQEPEPSGVGSIVEDTGVLSLAPRYQSATKNYLGAVWQWAKEATVRWVTEWHQQGVRLDYWGELTQQINEDRTTNGDKYNISSRQVFVVQASIGLAPLGNSGQYVGNGVVDFVVATYKAQNVGTSRTHALRPCKYRISTELTATRPGRLQVDLGVARRPNNTWGAEHLQALLNGLLEQYHTEGVSLGRYCPIVGAPMDYKKDRFQVAYEQIHKGGWITTWPTAYSTADGRGLRLDRTYEMLNGLVMKEIITVAGLPR